MNKVSSFFFQVSSPALEQHFPAHAQQQELIGQVTARCVTLSAEETMAIEEEEMLITDTELLEEEERLITDLADLFFTDLSPSSLSPRTTLSGS